jgi:TRAP-type mannitol/chloroaromatic compound transport system substrate-binding protein
VISDMAAADPLSREVMDSITAFRKQAIAYAKVSEQAFYNARGLPFKWID